jgi:hypothetical protein
LNYLLQSKAVFQPAILFKSSIFFVERLRPEVAVVADFKGMGGFPVFPFIIISGGLLCIQGDLLYIQPTLQQKT